MLGLWLLTAAWADVPDGVVPITAPVDAQQRFDEHRQHKGLPASVLACDVVWPDVLQVCFRIRDGEVMRFVHAADLAAWGIDGAGFRAVMAARASERLPAGLVAAPVTDMEGASYWYSAGQAGWECGGLLAPDAVAATAGSPMLVAMPRPDVLLAWPAGNEDLNRVMAIGVREMHDAGEGLLATVYQYGQDGWTPAFEARPSDTPAGSP